MSGLEALQSVQFVTWEGRRLAVIDGGDWDALVEWLENIEDVQAARQAYQALKGNCSESSTQKRSARSLIELSA